MSCIILKHTLKHLKSSYMFRSIDHHQGAHVVPCWSIKMLKLSVKHFVKMLWQHIVHKHVVLRAGRSTDSCGATIKTTDLFSGVRTSSLLDFKIARLRLRNITDNRSECSVFLRYRHTRLVPNTCFHYVRWWKVRTDFGRLLTLKTERERERERESNRRKRRRIFTQEHHLSYTGKYLLLWRLRDFARSSLCPTQFGGNRIAFRFRGRKIGGELLGYLFGERTWAYGLNYKLKLICILYIKLQRFISYLTENIARYHQKDK
jgi:hypothetical protein